MHVMEIEAALANRDDLRRARQLPELRDTFRVAVPGVMRMHSDGRPHVRITFRDFDRHAIGFDRADRADRHDSPHTRLARPSEHVVDLAAQLGICQMAVSINHRDHYHVIPPREEGADALGRLLDSWEECDRRIDLMPGLEPFAIRSAREFLIEVEHVEELARRYWHEGFERIGDDSQSLD